ncbi:MAG: DUF362 domain-containing protein [Magnetococcales bacterium]|nr:DUF362 domain-containing protein [Magnetococcales bacterium]
MEGKKPKKKNRLETLQGRRLFLKRAGRLSGGAAFLAAGGYMAYSDDPVRRTPEKIHFLPDYRVEPSKMYPLMAIVRGSNVDSMVKQAVDKLGGVSRFIKKGDTVLLKPNVGWDRMPEQGANTGPEVVGSVVDLCRQAGAGRVLVSDVSLNDPRRSFNRSGIEKAVHDYGGEVKICGSDDFVMTDMGGSLLKVWPVSRFLMEADKIINLPIVKHHSLSGCTLSMKNWYGVLGGRRNQLHQDIHTSIVDLAHALKPTLTIMDAVRVLKRNGPTGGNPDDVVRENTVIASLDEVALDSFSLGFLGLVPDDIPFLAMAEARKIGQVDWRSLNVSQSQLG